MTPKKLKELLGLGQKHMATLLNEDYRKYRSMERRKGKPISDAQRLFFFVANFRLVKGAFKTPLKTKDKIVAQNLSIYIIEDLQKRLRSCANEITIYRAKLSKLEAQLAKYNREFDIVNEIQAAVPETDRDLQDRITLLKRQLIETYTSFYYSILDRKLALNWKEAEYNTLAMELEMINIQEIEK
jgi:hypothetical protein